MADRSCRSRCGAPPLCRETPILLSDIKYNSTCITLQVPLQLACGECKKQLIHFKILVKNLRLSDKSQNVGDVNNIGAQNMI